MNKRPSGRGSHAHPRPSKPRRSSPQPRKQRIGSPFQIVEKTVEAPVVPQGPGAFRIVIAIHRPRFRSRAERGAQRAEWEVTALLNKQDPVGLCMKLPRPPDILVLSGDFGRQRDYAIFRAVQAYRAKGMRLVGLVDDCEAAPESHPDSSPQNLCDICITPPVIAADFRALFARIYTEIRKTAPPPLLTQAQKEAAEDEDEDDA